MNNLFNNREMIAYEIFNLFDNFKLSLDEYRVFINYTTYYFQYNKPCFTSSLTVNHFIESIKKSSLIDLGDKIRLLNDDEVLFVLKIFAILVLSEKDIVELAANLQEELESYFIRKRWEFN